MKFFIFHDEISCFFGHFSWYEISCFLVIFHGFFGHFSWLEDLIEGIWKDKLAMMPFQRDSKNMKNEIWPHFSWKHEKWGVKFHFSCFMKNKVFSLKDENLGEWKGLYIRRLDVFKSVGKWKLCCGKLVCGKENCAFLCDLEIV